MAESGARQRKAPTMRALVVPADPSKPVGLVDLTQGQGQLHNLQSLVGGRVEVQAHPQGDLWLHDEGRYEHPINERVSKWVVNDSDVAKSGELRGFEEAWCVYGDVVVTGPPDRNGDTTPVRQEMVDMFQGMEITPGAMADWSTREVDVIVSDWPEPPSLDTDLDQGYDGGMDR